MSFFFNKNKKAQSPSALPQATRGIKSADGPQSQGASLNGINGIPRQEFRPRSPTGVGGPLQNGVLNQKPSLEHQRQRSGSEDLGNGMERNIKVVNLKLDSQPRDRPENESRIPPPTRIAQPPPSRPAPDPSPYPWSQRQLTYSVPNSYPFPRYGPAVNSVASRDGVLYVMGGLVNGSVVKGDLWTIEAGQGALNCFPVLTTSEGPGPRVGHASLLVGNAFIVFGGDTKTEESDFLDETLYLLNTSTKQWSRAAPAGQRPAGRYGHTLNILGSKIYIFGGQVEGFFFNDLVAFDLNALQQTSNRWEILVQNTIDGGPPHGQIPPARTNHTIVSWNDHLYLFGGTDGVVWFNDVWAYDPKSNSWSEMECIGYIPTAREGHAAALIGDVMYVFGGRTEDGNDLGDLAAFRISSRRWYTFQNMGPSPSPRSGHTMTALGKTIVVLGGEPSSAPRDAGELSLAYFLDTTKIRYPPDSSTQQTQSQITAPQPRDPVQRDRASSQTKPGPAPSGIPQSRGMSQKQLEGSPQRNESDMVTGPGSRLPRSSGMPQQPGLQQTARDMSPQPQMNGIPPRSQSAADRAASPLVEGAIRNVSDTRVPQQSKLSNDPMAVQDSFGGQKPVMQSLNQKDSVEPMDQPMVNPPRGSSRQKRFPIQDQEGTPRPSAERPSLDRPSLDRPSLDRPSMDRPSLDRPPTDRGTPVGRRVESRQAEIKSAQPEVDSTPSATQTDMLKQLDAAKSQNAWYASELALARKAGYTPSANAPTMDESRSNSVADHEKPMMEALIKTRAELVKMQALMDEKSGAMADQISRIERQRDAAISEATFARARLAAAGGHPDADNTHEAERSDLTRRLALAIAAQAEISKKLEAVTKETESEKNGRQSAEERAETSQNRHAELESERQRSALELESLRAELHEAQRVARDESAKSTDAVAAHGLLKVDKTELEGKLEAALEQTKGHAEVLTTLQNAVTASTEKTSHYERKLDEERATTGRLQAKITELKSQLEERTAELEASSRQVRDLEELSEKHANEAKTHRTAVLEGFSKARSVSEAKENPNDERLAILQQQAQAASELAKSNQQAADTAAEKLRRAEERIAGLEAYQEQSSREGLTMRKQVHTTTNQIRALQEEKSKLEQQLQSQQLEANAINVQHSALRDVLAERGINQSELRKGRMTDSPSSLNRHGEGSADPTRLRELEQQLESSNKTQGELRQRLDEIADRDAATRREYEEKLTALDNDHQAAAKYLRQTEKMLSKMKQELQRVKQQSTEYLGELEVLRAKGNDDSQREAPADWEAERAKLVKSIEDTNTSLESKISSLQADLKSRDGDLEALQSSHATQNSDLTALRTAHDSSRQDLERLQKENSALEVRAKDAEQKVQMLLEQVESSVDNYRRQTTDGNGESHGHQRGVSMASISTAHIMGETPHLGHSRVESVGGDSIYSQHPSDGSHNRDSLAQTDRNSMAINSMMTELDGLRYRLSGKFDFERTPTTASTFHPNLANGLSEWRRGLERESTDYDMIPGKIDTRNDTENRGHKQGMSSIAEIETPVQGTTAEEHNNNMGHEDSKSNMI